MRTAVVTGASSGLGREFVKQLSEEGKLDEIWVIARRREKLEELASSVKMV
ncbi:SDR family NAD(P)-dependent oxidoreductase [uncultured Dialister sp.]|uniref:SDR family NAD(P)-dependent oxidoreductase n=1 Tax=uncultured Dialister sp. TaxID=278064 RepID=UPI00266F084E|nr:SDR family NAD(P)-dependent oxidoreductase [uncultured Dialister sp.]